MFNKQGSNITSWEVIQVVMMQGNCWEVNHPHVARVRSTLHQPRCDKKKKKHIMSKPFCKHLSKTIMSNTMQYRANSVSILILSFMGSEREG